MVTLSSTHRCAPTAGTRPFHHRLRCDWQLDLAPSMPTHPTNRTRWLVLLFVIGLVEALYAFDASAGFLATWPTFTTNYDLQAEGFRSGHLWVALAPAPELLAQADPFDPAHSRLWAWDLSLYKGHYYMYWGPLPALAIAAIKTAARLKTPIGDQFALFTFMSLTALSGALLIDRMARRVFPRVPFPV